MKIKIKQIVILAKKIVIPDSDRGSISIDSRLRGNDNGVRGNDNVVRGDDKGSRTTRVRKGLIILSVILALGAVFLHLSGKSLATWFDDSYSYRKKITIGNSGAAVSSARKVLVEVDTAALTTDKMQADCDDTRFTDINGKILRFFIDTGAGACDTSSTDYYVELPSITTGNNIIYMYYGNPAAINSANQNLIGPTWATSSSAPMPVAAYQPVGAASLASSYSNLINPGTYDAAPGTAPTQASATGWTFNGTTQYLTTGVLPGATYSAIVRFSGGNAVAAYKEILGSTDNVVGGFEMIPNHTGGNLTAAHGIPSVSVSPGLTSGVFGLTAASTYRNGLADGTLTANWSGVTPKALYIGSINSNGTAAQFWPGDIQALAIYNTTLTAPQVAAITTAMQGLTDGSNPGIATFTPTSGPTLASEETTPGPAAYWKFDDGQGTTAQDTTVNNNDGTISGATWTEESRCVSGKCLQFDGKDYVSVPSAFSNITGNVTTFETWVKINSYDSNGVVLFGTSTGTDVYWQIANDTIVYVMSTQISVSENFDDNKWHHVAFVSTASSTLFYFDGNLAGSGGAGAALSSGAKDFRLGSWDLGSNWDLRGFMDEPKIYPYARTAAQVKADYAKGSASKGGGVLGAADTSALSQGLVGYWKMDESTTPSLDSSGNSNSGSWNGNVAATTGKFGNGTTYDGTGDYVNVPDADSLDLGQGATKRWTVATWYRATGAGTSAQMLVAKRSATGSSVTDYVIYTESNSIVWGTGSAADSCSWQILSEPSRDVWHHIVGTLEATGNESGRKSIYIDGALSATCTYAIKAASTTDPVKLGAADNTANHFFNGKLDEARIYNRALSPAEVSQLYNFAPGPVGYWKMDEGTGTSANDTSGNGYTGTLTSGPTWTNGKFGSAVKFDGSDDSVSFSGLGSLSTSTLEFWFNPSQIEASGGTQRTIFTIGSCIFSLHEWAGSTKNYLFGSGCGNNYWNTGFVANAWQHVVLVQNSSAIDVYVNNVKKSLQNGSNNGFSTLNFATFSIGGSSTDLIGKVDDVRIYNYARTSKQIIEDLNAGHPTGGSPVGSSVATFHMDDMEGTVAEDSSINGNDLTLSSRSWTQSGKVNGAWNGTNAVWLSRADDSDFDVSATEDYAITGWVKSDSASNPGATEYVVNKASSVIAGYAVYFNTSGFLCFGIDDDTTWGPDIASCSTTDVYDAS